MKPYVGLMALLLGLGAFASAESPTSVLPACARDCVPKTDPGFPCSASDQACICNNNGLYYQMVLCMEQSCILEDGLSALNISSTSCGYPVRDRTNMILVIAISGGVLSLVALGLRICGKLLAKAGTFGMDDWAMLLTAMFTTPLAALGILLAKSGLGRDIWFLSPGGITRLLRIYFVAEIFYALCLAFTKISILLFYLRIFPSKQFRTLVYGTIAIVFCYAITFTLADIFQCHPIDLAWNKFRSEQNGKCNNFNAQTWANAAINIAVDITVLILPMPQLVKLSLSRKKKIGICLMFGVGIFVTIVSIVRLQSLARFANTHNITWDYVPATYWSIIEIDVGVVCACLPAIRALLSRVWPAAFASTSQEQSVQANRRTTASLLYRESHKLVEGVNSNFIELVEVESATYKASVGHG